MTHTSIHPNTTIGATALVVADLERSLHYYQHNIGLHLHQQKEGAAVLGCGEANLLFLTEQPNARPVQPGRTGLYHFALLVPSRLELARTLRNLIATRTPLSGASDHAVSEALYLTDPDGHGIEIYRDRNRSEWQFAGGVLRMTVDPFDFEGVLKAVESHKGKWTGLHPKTTMGHIHLHIAHMPAAEHFYCDLLGFDLIVRYGDSASFVSAGGYHHHIGLNVWAGVGAPPAPDDAARLHWYQIRLPDYESLQQVLVRLHTAGVPVTQQAQSWLVQDPAQNLIHLVDGSKQQ